MNSQSLFNTTIINKVENKMMVNVIYIATVLTCSLVIAAAAQVAIFVPVLSPVPFTLQTFAITLIALTTGKKMASLSVLAYILESAAGLPFLAGGLALTSLTASTGYIIGFIPMAYVIGLLADSGFANKKIGMLVTLFLGNAIVYGFGSIWMGILIGFDQPILELAVLPFVLTDTLKALLAVVLSKSMYELVRR